MSIRAEFTNIFNRTEPPNPTATNALATQTRNATTGLTTGGFGFINVLSAPVAATGILVPRQGTIVGRFTF